MAVIDDLTGRVIVTFAREPLAAAAFSPDRKTLVTLDQGGNAIVYATSGQALFKLKGQNGKITSVAYSPVALVIATASSDGSVQIWDAASRSMLHTLPGHGETVRGIVFSPNGKRVATVGSFGLRLWDVLSGNEVVLPSPIREPVYSVINSLAFSRDGKRLANGGRTISFWDTASGKRLPGLSGDEGGYLFASVAFSPGDERLATITPDVVQFWDYSVPEKPRLSRTVTASFLYPRGAVFSPDGNWLAFISRPRTVRFTDTVRFCDVASGSELFSLFGQTRIVTVAFSHEGSEIYALADDGTLYRHPVRIDDLMAEARRLYTGPLWTEDCDRFHLQETEPCQAASLVEEGRQKASGDRVKETLADRVNEALTDFKEAKQFDPLADLDPNAEVAKSLIKAGYQLATKGDVPSANLTFKEAIKLDPSLKLLELQTKAKQLASRYFVQNGDNLAERAKMQDATALFQKAIELDPTLKLPDLQMRANRLAAPHFVRTGENLAEGGDVQGAIEKFQEAIKLDPTLRLDPQTKAKQLAIQSWMLSSAELLRERKFTEAIGYFTKAETLDSTLIDATYWNNLCFLGSAGGHAPEVMFACKQALKLDPNNWQYLDSRGLARALTGDSRGAIQDFDFVIGQMQNPDWKAQRQRWVQVLRKGQKLSFTDDEIKQLLTQ